MEVKWRWRFEGVHYESRICVQDDTPSMRQQHDLTAINDFHVNFHDF